MMNQTIETNQRRSFYRTVENSDVAHGEFHSSLGWIGLEVTGDSLTRIEFLGTQNSLKQNPFSGLLKETQKQILAYLAGKLKKFSLPIHLEGTTFQQEVWQQMAQIPYGELVSYGELAQKIGRPQASRAVGGAANKNPVPLVIPCHRVVGKSGLLVGFAPGLSYKTELLRLEGHQTNGFSVA